MTEKIDAYELSEQADELLARGRRFKAERISSVCGRCQHAHIMRRKHKNDPLIVCNELGKAVPADIEECNKILPVGTLSIFNLAKLARVIDNRDEYKGDYR